MSEMNLLSRKSRGFVSDALALVGAGLTVAGIWQIDYRVALIVAGVAMVAVAVGIALNR